jgi:hypothetical protein
VNQICSKIFLRKIAANASIHDDSRITQHCVTSPIDPFVGIDHCGYHALNAGINQSLGAGSCAAMMGARLQRDVSRRTGCKLTGLSDCNRLGMRAPANCRNSGANDKWSFTFISHQNAGNGRICGSPALVYPGKPDCRTHKAVVKSDIWNGTCRHRTSGSIHC